MPSLEPALIHDLLQESMQQGKQPFVNVISDSMAPLIRQGDQVRIAPVKIEELEPGDIVVVSSESYLITHRYWGLFNQLGEAKLITKGDRPGNFDRPAPASQLVGRVVARRRNDRLLRLMNGPGQWLNRQLTRLAALDIRLFTEPIGDPAQYEKRSLKDSGALSNNRLNSNRYLVLRRIIYRYAWILTGAVGLSSQINFGVEDVK